VLQSITFPGLQSARAIGFLEARDGESTTMPDRRATLPRNSSRWTDGEMKLPDINAWEIGGPPDRKLELSARKHRLIFVLDPHPGSQKLFPDRRPKFGPTWVLDNCKLCIRLGTLPRNSSRWTDGEFSMPKIGTFCRKVPVILFGSGAIFFSVGDNQKSVSEGKVFLPRWAEVGCSSDHPVTQIFQISNCVPA